MRLPHGGIGSVLMLTGVGAVGNNSKYYGEVTVELSGLSAGTHTAKMSFEARVDADLTESNAGRIPLSK